MGWEILGRWGTLFHFSEKWKWENQLFLVFLIPLWCSEWESIPDSIVNGHKLMEGVKVSPCLLNTAWKKGRGQQDNIAKMEVIRSFQSRTGRAGEWEGCGWCFPSFFTLKLLAGNFCLVHLLKMFWSSRMKTRLHIQQMKMKNLPSHHEIKPTTRKQDSPLKTHIFPHHQQPQAWEG